MSQKYFFGLLKFFRDEKYLDALINGAFYCNTPEYYRLSNQEGVSDNNESCYLSYRKERNDEKGTFTIGGKNDDDIDSMTIYPTNSHDMWLHCWTSLKISPDCNDLPQLIIDINRLRKEFGPNYVFIYRDQLDHFVERLNSLTKNKLQHGYVKYSDNRNLWSAFCKSNNYLYQREYRFAYGDCSSSQKEPLEFHDKNGFEKLMTKNMCLSLQLTVDDTQKVVFYLDKEKCYSEICL